MVSDQPALWRLPLTLFSWQSQTVEPPLFLNFVGGLALDSLRRPSSTCSQTWTHCWCLCVFVCGYVCMYENKKEGESILNVCMNESR